MEAPETSARPTFPRPAVRSRGAADRRQTSRPESIGTRLTFRKPGNASALSRVDATLLRIAYQLNIVVELITQVAGKITRGAAALIVVAGTQIFVDETVIGVDLD